jgi:hypothetical protein
VKPDTTVLLVLVLAVGVVVVVAGTWHWPSGMQIALSNSVP